MHSSVHQPRKRFGQNFLKDPFIIQAIIDCIAAFPHIVEIGPGLGALTHGLIRLSETFTAIEIDRDLVEKFKHQFDPHSHPHIHIHQADALKFDFASLDSQPFKIVGNLPYNISTPILIHLFKSLDSIQDFHFMLQKEVVDRLAAEPNSEYYGRLSVIAQYFCKVEPLLAIPPESFYPEPKVDSAFVRLTPRKDRVPLPFESFQQIVREAFHCRRKTLANNFKQRVSKDVLKDWGFDPNIRPEVLSVEDFVKLAKHFDSPAKSLEMGINSKTY